MQTKCRLKLILNGKILKFKKQGDNWLCINKGAGYEVGVLTYYPLWKSWTFKPHATHIYSAVMLADIKIFMEQLKSE